MLLGFFLNAESIFQHKSNLNIFLIILFLYKPFLWTDLIILQKMSSKFAIFCLLHLFYTFLHKCHVCIYWLAIFWFFY